MRRPAGSGWRRSRSRPSASATSRPRRPTTVAAVDAHNAAIMDAVNRTGEVFLSHTKLNGRSRSASPSAASGRSCATSSAHGQLLQAAAEEVERR